MCCKRFHKMFSIRRMHCTFLICLVSLNNCLGKNKTAEEQCDQNIVFSLFQELLELHEQQEGLLNQLNRDAEGQTCLFSCPQKSQLKSECRWPKSCAEIIQDSVSDRVHKLQVPIFESVPFHAHCVKDQRGHGAAWTVIFRRSQNILMLNRSKNEFKNGLSSLYGDHFLSLDAIFAMTNYERHDLWIQLSRPASLINIHYTDFVIDNEQNNYMLLSLGNFTTDGLIADRFNSHIGQTFSTYDNDTPYKCATSHNAGWHFQGKVCYSSHLFGVPRKHNGIFWNEEEFDHVQMMIRPHTTTNSFSEILSI